MKKQLLLYVDDKDKTEKSQMIKIIELDYEFLQCKNEVLLMILIDITVYNISNCTIHTVLDFNFSNSEQQNISSHVYVL